jgi:hypothetical protein
MPIQICVICSNDKQFIRYLTTIRKIAGVKVLKRRSKPFYDITGELTQENDFLKLGTALAKMLDECQAQIAIPDPELKQKMLSFIMPVIEQHS